jgi:DNA-binding transcriptional regulator YiaG
MEAADNIFDSQYTGTGYGLLKNYPQISELEHTGISSAREEAFWKKESRELSDFFDIFSTFSINSAFSKMENYEGIPNLDRDVTSSCKQTAEIKSKMGLNILEMAAILQVSRPTVYNWLESDDVDIKKEHKERLSTIYKICKTWSRKHLGRLGIYLHQSTGNNNVSLFELLKSDKLDQAKIQYYLEHIANLMLKKRKSEEEHDALLRKQGFEPVSKEEMEDRLNDIDFLD